MDAPLRPVAQLLVDSVRHAVGRSVGPPVLDPAATVVPVADVVAAARMHRVTPTVTHYLEWLEGVPQDWRQPFALARHVQLVRHLRSRDDLRRIGEALDEAGVAWVGVKGPVVADGCWPRPDLREYHDLDVLVDRHRLGDALAVLEALGCHYVDRNWPLLRRTMRGEIAMVTASGTPLDVHWDLVVASGLRHRLRVDSAAALGRRRRTDLGGGTSVLVLDPVDTVLHLALHAALSGGTRLVWAADVWFAARLLTRPGLEELGVRATTARVELPVALMLDRAAALVAPLPDRSDTLLAPLHGAWARAARRRARVFPDPGLPGDAHLGGTLVASARRSLAASAAHAAWSTVRLRALERASDRGRPTQSDALSLDRPDLVARAAYLRRVQGHARP